jgi:hypothetical protein
MARHSQPRPLLEIARQQIAQRAPELQNAPLQLRELDGPPGAPRYAASSARCLAAACPYGVSTGAAAAGRCQIHLCPLRRSVRLLLNREGAVIQTTEGGVRWS